MEPSVFEPSPTSISQTPPLIWQRVQSTWLNRKPRASASLVAALSTLMMVIGSILHQRNFWNAHQWMEARAVDVFEKHELWRLWTTLFAHADLGHLVSNSILFFILGYFLNGYFGLLVFPSAALAFGGIINAIVLKSYPPDVALIGMSGVVYWMGGAWLALYFALDKRRTAFQRFLRIMGVALGLFMPASAFDPSISYGAHLVGFILGLLYGVLYYFFHRRIFEEALVIETVVDD